MKTEVNMKRNLFGYEITQKSKSEMFSATDLVKAGNQWRRKNNMSDFNLSLFFKQKSTLDFIEELEKKYDRVKISGRGRNSHTWVHPYLFIDIALAISPKLKIETYQWITDYLLKYRNDSGDSFKKMSGALYLKCPNKREFQNIISDVSNKIKEACNVESWDEWQSANEETLNLRNKIHENIALLVDILPIDEAVKIGILKAKK